MVVMRATTKSLLLTIRNTKLYLYILIVIYIVSCLVGYTLLSNQLSKKALDEN